MGIDISSVAEGKYIYINALMLISVHDIKHTDHE